MSSIIVQCVSNSTNIYRLGIFLCLAFLVVNVSAGEAAKEPCADYASQRRAYFGDLHVHTSYSQDAAWRMGARATPDDAYRFAKGGQISLPPYDASGNSARKLQLARTLDFAMVTDHAEGLAAVRMCSTLPEDQRPYLCGKSAFLILAARAVNKLLPVFEVPCAEPSEACTAAYSAAWQDTIHAAQEHQDDCSFTAFVGYEWSGNLLMANMHRNVVFRSASVPDLPINSITEPHVEGLWRRLDEQCRDADNDCAAITIPHNSNLSKGEMFSPVHSDGSPLTPETAARRARYERLAEIVQHKGASECFWGSGMGADELCSFEQLSFASFAEKYTPIPREEPKNDGRYLREALKLGLRERADNGINPFEIGFIGSTDSHIAASGGVEENNYGGHHGAQTIVGDGSQPLLPDDVEQNPGGLAVLYAEQNTRDALFAAMERREAYATSGPRIQLRTFAGWTLPEDMCQRADAIEQAYAHGVPMGGTLTPSELSNTPRLYVSAVRDPGSPGLPSTPLKHMQIVKGWVGADGSTHEEVYEVAGQAHSDAAVDLSTCAQTGAGHDSLCTVWEDPGFDPEQEAFYYTRVLENPSCRWHQKICVANQVDCSNLDGVPESLLGCCDNSVPRTINERAWSSPIWFTPQDSSK